MSYSRDQFIDPGIPSSARNNQILFGCLFIFFVLGGGFLIAGLAYLQHQLTHKKNHHFKKSTGTSIQRAKKDRLKPMNRPNTTDMLLAGNKIPSTPTKNLVGSIAIHASPKKAKAEKSYFYETNQEKKTNQATNAIAARQAIRRAENKSQEMKPVVQNNNDDIDNFAEQMYSRFNGNQAFSLFSSQNHVTDFLQYNPVRNRF